MAKLRFEIEGEPGRVALASYLIATSHMQSWLRELDAAITGTYRGTLNWYVASLRSDQGLSIELASGMKPAPKRRKAAIPPDQSQQVAASFVTGLENLEQKGISPPYLSEDGLRRASAMFNALNRNGARGYKATAIDSGKDVEASHKAGDAIRQLLPVSRRYIGSVEGRLETISIHGKQRFIVYHARTNKAVTCRFDDLDMHRLTGMFGERVAASGIIQSNIKGEPVRVQVDDLRVLGQGKLPTTDELAGSHPDFTDDMTTEEFTRYIRRG
jgi:hypothetical protein